MEKTIAEEVYHSLTGMRLPEYRLPWVEDAFAADAPCMQLYNDAMDAYMRLCGRLGVVNEDDDVEVIFNAFLGIEKILCIKMFEYGVRYGQKNMPRP